MRHVRWVVSAVALAVSLVSAQGGINLGVALENKAGGGTEQPVTVSVNRLASDSADTVSVELVLHMPENVHVYAAESLFFQLAHTRLEGVDSPQVHLPQPRMHHNYDGTDVAVYTDSQVFRISYPVRHRPYHVAGHIRYQACDNAMCFMPTTKPFGIDGGEEGSSVAGEAAAEGTSERVMHADWRAVIDSFETVGAIGGYRSAEQFRTFLEDPGSGSARSGGALMGKSIWLIVVLILLGGLALNLTPCVLPMLPITLAVIGGGTGSGNRRRGFWTGLLYGSGMALSYGALGAVVVMTGTTFGTHNASPVFNFAIAALFVVMSLAMFDIIHIDLTKYRRGGPRKGAGKLTTVGVFLMGGITALLAGACVAPVVIAVILYATALYAEGVGVAVLLPLLLGVGMAAPWPFAGAGMALLPKPGRWMVWVRNGFGVCILAGALYYGYTGYHLLQGQKVPEIDQATETTSSSQIEWHESLHEGLSRALQHNKPVLIDFWATWCKNCHAMEATTFRDSTVTTALSEYVLVKFQAEHPGEESTKVVLNHFKVVGLPTYVVLRPRETPEPDAESTVPRQ